MADYDDLVAAYDRTDAATTRQAVALTGVADDIRTLKDQIATGLTPDQVATLKSRAEASAVAVEGAAASLEALDAENPEGTVPA